MEDFEWISGYHAERGLCAIDRTTFQRTPEPSTGVYRAMAQRNEVS